MPYEYAANASVNVWNSTSSMTPIVVGLVVMVTSGIFMALLAYQPFFTWIWKKIGKTVYIIKSFIVGSAVYLGGRGIYVGVKAMTQIGSEYFTWTDVATGLIYFVILTLLGMVALYVGSRIHRNYLATKPKMEPKEKPKAQIEVQQ